MTERILLLVDDEENILRALSRVLRRDGYQILTAGSGEEALEVLGRHPGVGVILSDQRMPAMNGSEFLAIVKERYPDTVRIMLSGYTDLKSVTDAINQGAIYKFLTKPWDDDLLRANLREAFEQHDLKQENARLSAELAQANLALEQRVQDQGRVIDLNQLVLEISREILEQLPVGVIGVADDGMIAVANARMHQILGLSAGSLVGSLSADALPSAILELGHGMCHEVTRGGVELGPHHYRAYGAPLGEKSQARGCMLVMVPEESA